jgi:Right handed beta helix region
MKQSLFHIVVLTLLILTAITFAEAQATRTWISGVGDDVNPCSRTAPCKTFAGSISKTAPGGEINCLDPGGFGAVTITKSITLDCSGTFGSILTTTSPAITINAANGIVRLRGLSLTGQNGGTFGVRVLNASKVTIEDSVIDGFTNSGVSFESPGATTTPQLFISNTTIKNNTVSGVNISPSDGNPSRASIIRSQILGNGEGITAQATDVAVTDCMIAGNVTGIRAAQGGTARISSNTISENTTNLNAARGAILTYGNNAITGNGTDNLPTGTVTPAGLQ